MTSARGFVTKPPPVLLKADAELGVSDVYPVLVALREAGANDVHLATRYVANPR